MSRVEHVSALLIDIRTEMDELGVWSAQPPKPEALASTQPFCVDTLDFTEWVQWLLIPRLEEMIARDLPLPQNSQIHPMAEEVFKQMDEDTDRLLDLLAQLDQLLSLHH
ncbi:YqcC family protein [Marinobacterium sp. AK62]|uniref:YqcC family protein n=1 Tax=Marinobacterium alkalitolerans TaxID=1542925 RepID=A0ABS3Z8Z0_9GAMM|nr:YqcC family protein [Marinobacterium alkalitolerans]MBP0047743.1 YqcC family protein [Marinobacterium alkalitolerans]